MNSIHRRLLLSLLIGLLASTVIMVGIAYINTTKELSELFVDNLRRMAIVIEGQAFLPASTQVNPADMDTSELEESYVIQIWDRKGVLLRSSRPDLALPLQQREGLNYVTQDKQLWEIYNLKAGSSGYVQIAQPQQIVATMIGESALRTLLPFVFLFLLMTAGGWFAVDKSLSPLNQLSKTISEWNPDILRPLKVVGAPREIQPILDALNGILLKLDKAISLQREFTADSAHELRTPLTAIKLQLDNLTRAQSEQERQQAVQRLSEGIERCIHLASQLLIASRSMAVKTAPDFQPIRLNELVRSSMATFVVLASSKHIEIAFESCAECLMSGDEEGLRVLVNNLIDNAIRYTPDHGRVTVRVHMESERALLEIGDNGVGIPKDQRDKIFQRFYRIPGTVSTGSGLGLSIVRAVAEYHGAHVTIMNGLDQRGTTFRIVFAPIGSTAAPHGAAI